MFRYSFKPPCETHQYELQNWHQVLLSKLLHLAQNLPAISEKWQRDNTAMLILLLFIISSLTLASDCQHVNLINQPNSPFEKIPVYHQEKTNICYAYAAAQIADYYLIAQGAQQRSIHPAWLAYNYAVGKGRQKLDIGHTKEALAYLRDGSNCHFEDVSRALQGWSPALYETDASIIHAIEKASDNTPVRTLNRLLESNCSEGQRVKLNLPPIQSLNYRSLSSEAQVAALIQSRLDQRAAPISVSYCSNIWKDSTYHGIGMSSTGSRNKLKSDCHYHESIIVGKKQLQGSCHALVRNTLGAAWSGRNSHWKCLCKHRTTGEYLDDCEAAQHSSTTYSVEACWLPLEELSKNIGVVTFLE
jgi:hypothetical protein